MLLTPLMVTISSGSSIIVHITVNHIIRIGWTKPIWSEKFGLVNAYSLNEAISSFHLMHLKITKKAIQIYD